eukprot:8341328-Alexandrium_andersonii.AAC.1
MRTAAPAGAGSFSTHHRAPGAHSLIILSVNGRSAATPPHLSMSSRKLASSRCHARMRQGRCRKRP